jgi:hypothetical protein
MLFHEYGHRTAHGAAGTSAEKFYVILQDKLGGFPDCHIRLDFGIYRDDFNLLPKEPAVFIDYFCRIYDTLHVSFANIFKGAGKRFSASELYSFFLLCACG